MTTDIDDRQARRQAALDHVAALQAQLRDRLSGAARAELLELAEHLERAVRTFHLEAIRFRMFSLDRALKGADMPDPLRATFEALRRDLEAAGFSTRSH